MTPLVWRACHCYVWPIVPGYRAGNCKNCGFPPDTPSEEPSSGKAGPL